MKQGESQLQQLQKDVEVVQDVMEKNYVQVVERDVKLKEMDQRAEALLESSKGFQKTSKKLRKKVEDENRKKSCEKWKLMAIAGGVLLAVVIIIIIIIGSSRSS